MEIGKMVANYNLEHDFLIGIDTVQCYPFIFSL
jgi:hypothetical protein